MTRFTELERHDGTGLALLVDLKDPPRYYVATHHRRELISIGALAIARSRFANRVSLKATELARRLTILGRPTRPADRENVRQDLTEA